MGPFEKITFFPPDPLPKLDLHLVRTLLTTPRKLIFSTDEEVLTKVCDVLSDLSDGPHKNYQVVIDAVVCSRLVELMRNPSPALQTAALSAVGGILLDNGHQLQSIIDANALPCLLALMASRENGIRMDACLAISNITDGNEGWIQTVIDNNITQPLIQLLLDANIYIHTQAVQAISNATWRGSPKQIKFLVKQRW